ncbi:hypothetical protein NON20_06910 [Synechocystis sp. B12]|nr:hypothetical protein NON20_06910 [Synechocystis sp. B12]
MHKKSKAQLQDYFKDLTAIGNASSEQMEANRDGIQGETEENINPPPQNPKKGYLYRIYLVRPWQQRRKT